MRALPKRYPTSTFTSELALARRRAMSSKGKAAVTGAPATRTATQATAPATIAAPVRKSGAAATTVSVGRAASRARRAAMSSKGKLFAMHLHDNDGRWDQHAPLGHGTVDLTGLKVPHYVAVPGMNAVCREMAAELSDCRFEWRAQGAAFDGARWQVRASDGREVEADALLITTPPAQAMELLAGTPARSACREALGRIRMRPCWALMTALDRPLLTDWDAAFVNQGPLGWICSQAARPGRPAAEAWVLHATPEWSQEHLEQDPENVAEALLEAALSLPGVARAEREFSLAHRWRFALAEQPQDQGCHWFDGYRLGLAGDWCAGSRVEGAYLSGAAAAGALLGSAVARAGMPAGAMG